MPNKISQKLYLYARKHENIINLIYLFARSSV